MERHRAGDGDRELEGGLVDVVEVDTPALLTIQTGINQPRYANLRAIKQAEQQEVSCRQRGDGRAGHRVAAHVLAAARSGRRAVGGKRGAGGAADRELLKERL